ncbi:hypothetical protein Rumeso_02495 [Rubellimicrobium mesophilum DSM 19309]|uniref:EamA domain-containing protein n=1 Tax=Rubellimicrobium mesophilum DSM 19309 TaxID=442562 RepID=A0A017HN12_9RHOB|nr:DMT family transporter [Rubellimicrobium mesophilum]EYD75877.1 hypothetical protein Rumeso_02495 [Rubellimicrobium mesophilum DSM 19309]
MTMTTSVPMGGTGLVLGRSLRGVLLYAAAVLFFATMDTTTKTLAAHWAVPLIVAARYLSNLALMAAVLGPSQGRRLVRTHRTGLVLLRGLALAVASLTFALALERMPVAETTAVTFLLPILVVLVAGPLLGERIGRLGWVAAAAGFAGVLLIVRPGSGLDAVGVGFVLLNVLAGLAYQLLSRLLAGTESTLAMLFLTALVGSVAFGLALPWTWGGPMPTPGQLLLFLSLGVTGGVGHYLLTSAYRYAPASLLAPVQYLQLVWAALLGWLVFGHVPDAVSGLGMAVVVGSGLMVALRSRHAPR